MRVPEEERTTAQKAAIQEFVRSYSEEAKDERRQQQKWQQQGRQQQRRLVPWGIGIGGHLFALHLQHGVLREQFDLVDVYTFPIIEPTQEVGFPNS